MYISSYSNTESSFSCLSYSYSHVSMDEIKTKNPFINIYWIRCSNKSKTNKSERQK